MTLLVAITGGIGSGKSTFSKEVEKRNLKILDSDKEVGLIYKKPKKEFLKLLKKIGLGKAIKNKRINKKTVRDIIFSNKEIKLKLEKHIFTTIRKQRTTFIKKEKKLKTKIVFFDIPLLFENNLKNDFDLIISIITTKKERFRRLKASKKISKQLFNKIIKSQTSDKVRKLYSDRVIYNNNTLKKYIKNINNTLNNIIP